MLSELGEVQAAKIRGGYLELKPGAEQVHRSSWEDLAKINERGFVTFNSQDTVDSQTGEKKDYERCFVDGVMEINEAKIFVDRINLGREDIIAMLCYSSLPVSKFRWPDGTPLRGASIAVTRHFNKKTGQWFRTANVGALTSSQRVDSIGERFGCVVIGVQVFDTKWGRAGTARRGLFKAILKALNSKDLHEPCGIWAKP